MVSQLEPKCCGVLLRHSGVVLPWVDRPRIAASTPVGRLESDPAETRRFERGAVVEGGVVDERGSVALMLRVKESVSS